MIHIKIYSKLDMRLREKNQRDPMEEAGTHSTIVIKTTDAPAFSVTFSEQETLFLKPAKEK